MTRTELPSTQVPPVLPPMGAIGFLRWAWRQLTSMRVALILLLCLAVVSVPGSILPQRGTNPILVEQWIADAPTWGPILDRLGFFDVYASAWFAAVYLLLFISLVGCVIPRTRDLIVTMRKPPPPAPRNLSRLPDYLTFGGSGIQPGAYERALAYFRRGHWQVVEGVRTNSSGQQVRWIAAQKGTLREVGNLIFHVALVGILVGVAAGALFGWRGNVIVREGQGFSNTLTQFDAWGGGRLVDPSMLQPFAFTLEDFAVEFERGAAQRGAPRLFEAHLDYSPGLSEPASKRLVEVNKPLTVPGARVYLVGHGYAPTFRITDASGQVVFDDAVVFLPQDGNFTSTGVIKVPDANPQLGIQGLFLPTAAVDEVRGPHSIFPAADDPAAFLSAWTGDMGLDDGKPQSVYSLDTSRMQQLGLESLRPGQTWSLPNGAGTITLTGWQRWASFQLSSDPGQQIALISALLALIGLVGTLLIRRRRVWVSVTDEPSTIEVAGLSRSESTNLSDDVQAVRAAIMEMPNAGGNGKGM
jgi:cytochrome c biogenesis protein